MTTLVVALYTVAGLCCLASWWSGRLPVQVAILFLVVAGLVEFLPKLVK